MQLRLPLLVLILSGVAAEAHAAQGWVDGPQVEIPAWCGATNGETSGIVSRAGYVVDPVAETPQLGQVVYAHAVATNTNCVGDAVTIDFFLPAGASLAISPRNPVGCLLHQNATSSDAPGCSQSPLAGSRGGLAFVASPTFLPPKNSTDLWSLEIRVPVVFGQVSVDAPLTIETESGWGDSAAIVGATVPFQPALPPYARGDDLVLLGSSLPDAGTLPVAFSNDDGSFTVTNYLVGDFAMWARTSNVTRLTGDFNKDGHADYALVGGSGWRTIPVAMSQADGKFTITNNWVGDFGIWAETSNVKPLAGDFNRDGHTDIALVGGAGWHSIPIAFSARGGGNGYFEVTNVIVGDFATWAAASGARPIVGDYNRDGMSDIALVGGASWATLPVAYSYGNGSFQVFNPSATGTGFVGYYPYSWNFAQTVNEPGAQVIATDFNKDGMTDLLVVGGSSQGIRFAMSYGNGTWQLFEKQSADFATWTRAPGVKVLVGDFNKDGWPDLALTGVSGWNTIPVATNAGAGNFTVTNQFVGDFGSWAATSGVRAVVGDFNGDGFSDIALTGGNGWGSIPVAFGIGGGGFAVVNAASNRFPRWSSDTAATVFAGRVNY